MRMQGHCIEGTVPQSHGLEAVLKAPGILTSFCYLCIWPSLHCRWVFFLLFLFIPELLHLHVTMPVMKMCLDAVVPNPHSWDNRINLGLGFVSGSIDYGWAYLHLCIVVGQKFPEREAELEEIVVILIAGQTSRRVTTTQVQSPSLKGNQGFHLHYWN